MALRTCFSSCWRRSRYVAARRLGRVQRQRRDVLQNRCQCCVPAKAVHGSYFFIDLRCRSAHFELVAVVVARSCSASCWVGAETRRSTSVQHCPQVVALERRCGLVSSASQLVVAKGGSHLPWPIVIPSTTCFLQHRTKLIWKNRLMIVDAHHCQ